MAKGLRPARCYHWDSPAYTRTANNPSDSFITGIPSPKIVHFDMGNVRGKFDTEVVLIPETRIMVRHNSLEAARVMVQKLLEKKIGVANYHFKINVYPHHVMRENVMATGAGADRVQDGMRKAFGKPIGKAAMITRGQPVMTVHLNEDEQRIRVVRNALNSAKNKLPGEMKVVVRPKK